MKTKSIAIIGHIPFISTCISELDGGYPDIVEESGMHDVKTSLKTYAYKNDIYDMPKMIEVEPIKSPKEFGQQKLGINKRRKRR